MDEMKSMVAEWHKAFGVPFNITPTIIDTERAALRARLIDEESDETQNAMGRNATARIDLVEIADGCADLLYVIFGACLEFGIPIEEVFAEVHRSNMSKMWTPNEMKTQSTNQSYIFQEANVAGLKSYICKRADGKIIKSPSYSPANIQPILERHSK